MNKSAIALSAALVFAVATLAQAPTAGKVLLLTNHRVLEGDVTRAGDAYRVGRAGGETLVPARDVLTVCADLDAAYKVLLGRGDARDGAHRLTLAKWCFANGLRRQAAAEAKAAAQLRPQHRESQALAKSFGKLAGTTGRYDPPASTTTNAIATDVPADCSPEAHEHFALRVQPVLMNACAGCHTGPKVGAKFRLERAFAESPDKRRATQVNLGAVCAALDRAKPAASPLLVKALAAHGGAAVPAIRDRGVPAFKVLEDWVALVAGTPAALPAPVAQTPAGNSAFGKDEPKPAESTEPADPFDPVEFNRGAKKKE